MQTATYSLNLLSQKIYWINKLSRKKPETNLIPDYIRPSVFTPRNKSFSFELSADLSQTIIKLAQGSHFSTYWILLSALNVLMQKYSGNDNVIVGMPVSENIENNYSQNSIIPLLTRVSSELTFKDFLFQVKDAIIAAYNNQSFDLSQLTQLLDIPTNDNRCSFFDLVVLLDNIHHENDLKELNHDLTISFLIKDQAIVGTIKYKDSLFKSQTIELISKYYSNILESVLENIEIRISQIATLKDADEQQLLTKFNQNTHKYPIAETINQLFEKQVAQTPDKIAVTHQSNQLNQLTYQELNHQANQLARLLRQLGVCKGEFVGILKDRDLNFLIAILAIYKAGGAYVPIDSTYPSNRIEYMLSNSEVKFLLTDSSLLNVLVNYTDKCSQLKSIICLDQAFPESIRLIHNEELTICDRLNFTNLSTENLEPVNEGIDAAYMIYTSGSTGLPKGTIVRHDGAINHIYAQFDELKLNEEFCFLQSAPSSTDISVWQFLAPLLIGGKTVIVDLETVAIAEKLFQALKSAKITVVELVPTLFKSLLEYASQLPIQDRTLPDLQWMMLSGESISVEWINRWIEIYPHIPIANAYGPSEAADDITQYIIDQPLPENQRTVPIGKPLANLNLYILDQEMKLLPIGAPGEICVSGIGVGNGYWKNEAKTKLSFVTNPFTSQLVSPRNHDVIYQTGDLGRWLTDGNIEFLGRIDHQVKIRGFRVELGEIEAVLRQHPAVKETVVVVREDNPHDKCLAAYLVIRNSQQTEGLIEQLRSLLKEKLPQHMIPADFIWLEKIPIAPSGKVDQKALPAPDRSQPQLKFVAPRNPTEEIIADIWCQILKREKIGIYDDFFALGGHSLLATQVVSRLREAFQIELPLRSLFEMLTVARIVEYIEQIKTVQQLQNISPNSFELTADREEIEL
jgi:amino acid adenylation domain-containing protein